MTSTDHPLFSGPAQLLPGLRKLHEDLHAHPELSFQRKRTVGIVSTAVAAFGGGAA